MLIDISWALVALLAGLFIGFGVSAGIAWRWVHPKPAKEPKGPKVIMQPAPVTVVSKPDPALHQPSATKPQPVVKSA